MSERAREWIAYVTNEATDVQTEAKVDKNQTCVAHAALRSTQPLKVDLCYVGIVIDLGHRWMDGSFFAPPRPRARAEEERETSFGRGA